MRIRKFENIFIKFINESVKHFKEIGSIAPDSAICVDSIVKSVPFESAELILEYGGGSGAVTGEIIKRREPESTFICFEKNNNFYHSLRQTIKGPNIFVLHEDVFNSKNVLLSKFNIQVGSVDCIISTLPWSLLDFEELLEKEVLPLLKEDGIFIQYMYSVAFLNGFRLRPILKKYFTQIDLDFVFFNIPPTFVYTCRGNRNPNI